MKESTAVLLFAGVFLIAILFGVYNIFVYGWQADKSSIYWTVGIFGSVGLFWFLYGKFHKGQ